MKLHITPFDSDRFVFVAEKGAEKLGVFSADASDLQDRHIQQLYDDACDVGLAIRSTKTGTVITYFLSETNRKQYDPAEQPEIVSWEYLPLPEDVRKHPECAKTKVFIFND